MERLTERIKRLQKDDLIVYTNGKYEDTIPAEMTNDDIRAVLKKLADYEDLEEQGLLIRLPCKVGDILYCIVNGEVKKLKVHSFGVPDFEITNIESKYVDGFKIVRFVGEVGKTVFLTREEAEKKLEEMKAND
jgi:hypothetical protein|nr:MAG TPA: hypothetical protein [Caudoviricetes sp.]